MKIVDLLSNQWAITPEALNGVLDVIGSHNQGPKIDLKAMEQAQIDFNNFISNPDIIDDNENYAIVPIKGVLMKRPSIFERVILDAASMDSIKQEIQMALDDSSIDTIILDVDSPGGTVDGTKELADFIYDSRSEKRVITYSDGVMASAGYWIGAAASEIYIANETINIGSIGVIASHIDKSAFLDGMGIKITDIYSGKFKAAGSENKPLDNDSKDYLQSRADTIYSIFVKDVAKFRGVSVEQVLTNMADGRVFIGQDAINNKLVDGVSTITNLIGENSKMKDINEFKAHEFYGQAKEEIIKDMTVKHDAEIKEAKEKALSDERFRISAIQDLSLPGYEKVIDEGIKSGASASDISTKIILAQKEDLKIKAEDLENDAPEVLPEVEPVVPEGTPEEKDFNALVLEYSQVNKTKISEARAAVIQNNPKAYENYKGGL